MKLFYIVLIIFACLSIYYCSCFNNPDNMVFPQLKVDKLEMRVDSLEKRIEILERNL